MARHACCGMTLETGARIVAFVDVIIGLLSLAFMGDLAHRKLTWADEEFDRVYGSSLYFQLPGGIYVMCAVCNAIQAGMGIVLYVGVVHKSIATCLAYLWITGCTMLFTGPLIRLLEICIVYKLYRELEQEAVFLRTHFPIAGGPEASDKSGGYQEYPAMPGNNVSVISYPPSGPPPEYQAEGYASKVEFSRYGYTGVGHEHTGVGYSHTGVGYEHTGVGYNHTGVGYEHTGVGYNHTGVGYEYGVNQQAIAPPAQYLHVQ